MNFPNLTVFGFELIGLVLAGLLGLFLFWRACRHELYESQEIFDWSAAFFAGFLIFGRIVDFFARFDYYKWSIKRLLFFNTFGGFDNFGALMGGVFVVWFYMRQRRKNFWKIFDLAAAPIAFSATIFALFRLFAQLIQNNLHFSLANLHFDARFLFWFLGYFVIFYALKRFETKKKHNGFFVCFLFVAISILNMALMLFGKSSNKTYTYYFLGSNLVLFILFASNWYLLLKRKIWVDVKSFFGGFVLSVFKLRRVLTNIREADNTAKSIILFPLVLAKHVATLVKYLSREFMTSIIDLVHTFGLGK